jgi:hypothetical protein
VTEESEPPYSLLCSACRTPCTGTDAHVIPRWNPELRSVMTAYRCGNCWPAGLEELRTAVRSGDPEVRASFADFLERRAYSKDAAMLRGAAPEEQLSFLLTITDLLDSQRLIFEP